MTEMSKHSPAHIRHIAHSRPPSVWSISNGVSDFANPNTCNESDMEIRARRKKNPTDSRSGARRAARFVWSGDSARWSLTGQRRSASIFAEYDWPNCTRYTSGYEFKILLHHSFQFQAVSNDHHYDHLHIGNSNLLSRPDTQSQAR